MFLYGSQKGLLFRTRLLSTSRDRSLNLGSLKLGSRVGASDPGASPSPSPTDPINQGHFQAASPTVINAFVILHNFSQHTPIPQSFFIDSIFPHRSIHVVGRDAKSSFAHWGLTIGVLPSNICR